MKYKKCLRNLLYTRVSVSSQEFHHPHACIFWLLQQWGNETWPLVNISPTDIPAMLITHNLAAECEWTFTTFNGQQSQVNAIIHHHLHFNGHYPDERGLPGLGFFLYLFCKWTIGYKWHKILWTTKGNSKCYPTRKYHPLSLVFLHPPDSSEKRCCPLYASAPMSDASSYLILIMATLCNMADHYIFALGFLLLSFFFFPCLISAVPDWMSTILPHMVWP